MKENTENHLKLACEKLQEFQLLSTVNTANVKELEAEMVTAKKKISELSEAVTKTNWLQGLINNKIALTGEKLNELPEKDEVDALIGEVKELQDEKLSEVQGEVSDLQIFVNRWLQGLQSQVSGTKTKVLTLKAAICKLRDQGQSDRQENSFKRSQIAQMREELRAVRDELSASQQWWQSVIFVFEVVSVFIFFLVLWLLSSLQSQKGESR